MTFSRKWVDTWDAPNAANAQVQPLQPQLRFGPDVATVSNVAPPPVPQVEDKIAMFSNIPRHCPECLCTYQTTRVDELRIRFDHSLVAGCSRSNSYFIRPIAQFIQFI